VFILFMTSKSSLRFRHPPKAETCRPEMIGLTHLSPMGEPSLDVTVKL
jgi:hypothetical protein